MSSNLRAEPVNREKTDLGTALKFALRKRFGEPLEFIATHDLLPYLHGLIDASQDQNFIEDVNKLIQLIDIHKQVKVKEEY